MDTSELSNPRPLADPGQRQVTGQYDTTTQASDNPVHVLSVEGLKDVGWGAGGKKNNIKDTVNK